MCACVSKKHCKQQLCKGFSTVCLGTRLLVLVEPVFFSQEHSNGQIWLCQASLYLTLQLLLLYCDGNMPFFPTQIRTLLILINICMRLHVGCTQLALVAYVQSYLQL